MLVNLHVKNFAIIDEADIDFGEHLNILTGETGAGKSILVGSISIALGARVSPDMIGKRGDHAMVEAVFQIEDKHTLEKIRMLDIDPEDNQVVIARKITESRSVNKINGESVPVSTIKKVAALCIDIHGQHEHQSLLREERHREIVDEFGGKKSEELLTEVGELYRQYIRKKREVEKESVSSEERERQLAFLTYEKEEIESVALKQGEIESLEERHRRVSHAGEIVDALSEIHQLSTEVTGGALSQSLRRLQEIQSLDSTLDGFARQLMEVESLLGDFNRDVSGFMQDFSFDESELREIEQRLDGIRTLQSKYGETYEQIMAHREEAEQKIQKYMDFEAYQENLKKEFDEISARLQEKSEALSEHRKKCAHTLEKQITSALEDLNFAHVDFAIEVREKGQLGADGKDVVEFMIATNPGEPRRSLGKVASGGELSRIMLAIKSVFADSDEIETLIFDEIDTGISGRTAQKVSEKMSLLGKKHQIICITHLAQIAAMADRHFAIEKSVGEAASTTRIRPLDESESLKELARLLGGMEITDAVMENAREMKKLAAEFAQKDEKKETQKKIT